MKKAKQPQTLSLCMIVKNEERFLPDCLESVKDIVDQIVIVDTGSEDNTVEIAKRYGAEVHYFKWCDDFSAARNESIKYATGDWILWMDADERLLPESIPEFKNLMKFESKPVIYKIHIYNIKKNGKNYSLSNAHRLFNNYKRISFSGRIHEQISPSVAKLKGVERDSNISLHHIGYSLEGEKAEEKVKRNQKLLEKMVREFPNNAYAHYTLAQHYGMLDKPEKALVHYHKAYNLKQFEADMTASLLNIMSGNLLKLNKVEEALEYTKKSTSLKPIQASGYYLLYKISVAKKEDEKAINWLQKLLTMTKKIQNSKTTLSSDILINEDKILLTLGSLYYKNGRIDEALECFKKSSQKNPDNTDVIKRLIEIYIRRGNFQLMQEYLTKLNNLTYDDLQYLNSIGTLLIQQKKFRESIKIYETIALRAPNDEDVLKRLIGLYGKVGNMQKANELLTILRKLN